MHWLKRYILECCYLVYLITVLSYPLRITASSELLLFVNSIFGISHSRYLFWLNSIILALSILLFIRSFSYLKNQFIVWFLFMGYIGCLVLSALLHVIYKLPYTNTIELFDLSTIFLMSAPLSFALFTLSLSGSYSTSFLKLSNLFCSIACIIFSFFIIEFSHFSDITYYVFVSISFGWMIYLFNKKEPLSDLSFIQSEVL